MKLFLLFSLFLSSISFSQKPAKKFLYLQNQANDKIKKINLDHSKWLSYTVDSTGDNYYTYYTRDSYSPSDCKFGKDEIEFHFNEVNYSSWLYQENVEYEDSWNIFVKTPAQFFLTPHRQKHRYLFDAAIQNWFCTFWCRSWNCLFSTCQCIFVAPMLGLTMAVLKATVQAVCCAENFIPELVCL